MSESDGRGSCLLFVKQLCLVSFPGELAAVGMRTEHHVMFRVLYVQLAELLSSLHHL